MTTKFPRELVHKFLDYLAEDLHTLKSCSLVCREWVFRSRSHLFEKCPLSPSKILGFCDLLRSSACTILLHVRSIYGIKHYGPKDYRSFNKVAVDLSRLTNVCELKMTYITIYRPANLEIFFLTAFPRLRRLVLTFQLPNRVRDVPQLVVNMVCLFPTLQELDIRTSQCVLEDIPANMAPPPDLRSLALRENSMGPILAWLDAVGHLLNIRSLIPPCVSPCVPTVPTVTTLRRLGELGALHHLDITLDALYDYTADESAQSAQQPLLPPGTHLTCAARPSSVFDSTVIDLSLHPNLLTLHINHSGWTDDQATQMITMITKLAAPALEHLSLDLDLGRSVYQSLEWAALDAFLTQARFPQLRSVNLRCNAYGEHFFDDYDEDEEEPEFDEEHDFLRRALPLLKALGLLQTEW
ncbi:hypothetical protein B0H19DRAFT_1251236 [Mycena capillaripes]|nr:hypothetical protein B0H19DRAFT_1251236 [Mycena capillaripes]